MLLKLSIIIMLPMLTVLLEYIYMTHYVTVQLEYIYQTFAYLCWHYASYLLAMPKLC